LDLSGFFGYVCRWIGLSKKLDTSDSSSDIGNNWIYLDFLGMFVDGLAYPKDLIFRILHLTLGIIGFIWIFTSCLSKDFPAINYGDLVFSASLTWNQPPLY
jgi:hypothetical protein